MDSGEYIRELDIRLKERDRSFKIRQAEIEKEVDERYERIREEVRKENEEQKKKLSYKILSTTFKVFVFFVSYRVCNSCRNVLSYSSSDNLLDCRKHIY